MLGKLNNPSFLMNNFQAVPHAYTHSPILKPMLIFLRFTWFSHLHQSFLLILTNNGIIFVIIWKKNNNKIKLRKIIAILNVILKISIYFVFIIVIKKTKDDIIIRFEMFVVTILQCFCFFLTSCENPMVILKELDPKCFYIYL